MAKALSTLVQDLRELPPKKRFNVSVCCYWNISIHISAVTIGPGDISPDSTALLPAQLHEVIYSIRNIQGHDGSFSLRRGVLLYWAMGCPGEMGRFSCCGFFSPNNHDMWYAAFPNQCQGPVLVDRQHEYWNAVACHLYLLAQRSPFICPHFNSPAPLYYPPPGPARGKSPKYLGGAAPGSAGSGRVGWVGEIP